VITVEKLTKTYLQREGRITALDEVTLDVQQDALLGITGASGAGKSTLARLIALRERPDRGAIRLDGSDLLGSASALRRQVTAVPDASELVRQRTAAGNVALPLEQAGLDGPARKQRVGKLLDVVGLADRAGAGLDQLSSGARLRVAVARALATGASVLLADEPTASVDPAETAGVLTVLDRVRAELGTTVLLFTGDGTVLRRGCDEVAVLDAGKLVEHGSLHDLGTDPSSRTADLVLPKVDPPQAALSAHDRVAEIVLVGFAAVGALLPEAASRFDVDIELIGGGMTRFGDTPVARFGIGVSGARAESALAWIAEAGGSVHRVPNGPQGVAA
jgi:D-methionine transport system ATP-binding protein